MPALTLHEEPLGAAASASSSGLVAAVTENFRYTSVTPHGTDLKSEAIAEFSLGTPIDDADVGLAPRVAARLARPPLATALAGCSAGSISWSRPLCRVILTTHRTSPPRPF